MPQACLRDINSPTCQFLLDLWIQRGKEAEKELQKLDLEHLLDDQRFWIDQDARARRDDRDYELWFDLEYNRRPR